MLTNNLQKLIALSKRTKTKMSFEQRVCQMIAIIVFFMSVAFYAFGFHNLPMMESYTLLLLINVAMLISHISRNGIKTFS